MDKWNLFLRHRRVEGFWLEEDCLGYVRQLCERWDGGATRYLAQKQYRPRRTAQTPRIEACVISCPARREMLRQTLANLRASDWGERPVHVQMDSSDNPSPKVRQTENSLHALQAMMRTPATHVLFLEDDLQFNCHLVHNLGNWAPIAQGFGLFASLYNPGARMVACDHRRNFFLGSPDTCFGSQAFVIAREAVKYIIDCWESIDGMQDIRISRLASKLQPQMFYHAPSLVQHIGQESSWGGGFHQARDFEKEWKAMV